MRRRLDLADMAERPRNEGIDLGWITAPSVAFDMTVLAPHVDHLPLGTDGLLCFVDGLVAVDTVHGFFGAHGAASKALMISFARGSESKRCRSASASVLVAVSSIRSR